VSDLLGNKQEKSSPRLMDFSTKAIGAKAAYKEFLKEKAKDFSKIETEFFRIREMLKISQENQIDNVHTQNTGNLAKGNCKHNLLIFFMLEMFGMSNFNGSKLSLNTPPELDLIVDILKIGLLKI